MNIINFMILLFSLNVVNLVVNKNQIQETKFKHITIFKPKECYYERINSMQDCKFSSLSCSLVANNRPIT